MSALVSALKLKDVPQSAAKLPATRAAWKRSASSGGALATISATISIVPLAPTLSRMLALVSAFQQLLTIAELNGEAIEKFSSRPVLGRQRRAEGVSLSTLLNLLYLGH